MSVSDILREAIDRLPGSLWLRMEFTEMLLRENQELEEAEKQLGEALRINPKQKAARLRLQQLLQKRENWAAANATA